MSDWWIDESPPRDPPEEAPPLAFTAYVNWSRQAGKSSLAKFADRITQVFVHAAPTLSIELKPEPETPDPTKKSYPTSNQVNQSRRSYRR